MIHVLPKSIYAMWDVGNFVWLIPTTISETPSTSTQITHWNIRTLTVNRSCPKVTWNCTRHGYFTLPYTHTTWIKWELLQQILLTKVSGQFSSICLRLDIFSYPQERTSKQITFTHVVIFTTSPENLSSQYDQYYNIFVWKTKFLIFKRKKTKQKKTVLL